jgi:putative aldouronate transport system permease protein
VSPTGSAGPGTAQTRPPDRPPARSAQRTRRRGRVSLRARFRRDWQLLVMCIPMVVLFGLFNYLPMLGHTIAFQDYSPFRGDSPLAAYIESPWLGFTNFADLFADPRFWTAFRNTLVIFSVQLIFFFPLPIFLAILMNSILSRKIRSVVQTIIYLPHFFSWVLVVAFFQQMLGGAGLIAQIMHRMDTDGRWGIEPINFMTNPDTFVALVTSQVIWKDAGWGMIVFLAALTQINPNLYEAASADGAGPWRRFWHITLPGLRPVIVLLLILRLGNALSVGFEQFILQRDFVGARAAEVLDTFVYFVVFGGGGSFSYGAAAGLFNGVVGLILILSANRVAHMLGEDGIYRKVT